MGYDISYHPVDERFIHQEVIGFVSGQTENPTLIDRGVQIARNRFNANAWGLGVSEVHSERIEVALQRRGGFMSRLLGREAPLKIPPPPFEFDTDLYVWGRPFFITSSTPEEVSSAVDRYLEADDAGTEEIARCMVKDVAPRHFARVRPRFDGPVPSNEDFRQALMWRLELFRSAFAAIDHGGKVQSPDGGEHDALEIFSTDFALAAVMFMAHFRPGWMTRGYVWPSYLFRESGLDLSWFEPADKLFIPLIEANSRIKMSFRTTIKDNFSIGGYVPAARAAGFAAYYRDHEKVITSWARGKGWGNDADAVFRKLREAIHDASSRGMGFLEASEVYSGPLGIMN